MTTKILVVDDDLLLQRSLAYRLKAEGYVVITATTSEEALGLARHERLDLILLDIGLPDQDGLETARLLDRELKVPLIFLTARNQETDVVMGLELGAEDYVAKPFRMQELLARIRVVLRRAARLPVQAVDEPLVVGDVGLIPGNTRYGCEVYLSNCRPKSSNSSTCWSPMPVRSCPPIISLIGCGGQSLLELYRFYTSTSAGCASGLK
jgi:DNA-binding response OmpR family regulator